MPALFVVTTFPAIATDENGFVLGRSPLQAKWLEQVRILLQDSSDALMYGGELAPGAAPPGTLLQLVPILQMQITLQKCQHLLADPSNWASLVTVLTTGPFETVEFKRTFNAFSDNIYYSSGSEEANAYMLGGATPSSRQTTQYLLRNEALKQLGEVVDELRYQLRQPSESRESDLVLESMDKLLSSFDDYLSLVPASQLSQAQSVLGQGSSGGQGEK